MSEQPTSEADLDDWDVHWDSFGEAAKGNPANHYRQTLILKLLGSLPETAHVLDIGSGQGELAFAIKRQNPLVQVRGLEYSAEGVRRSVATAAGSDLDVEFRQSDLLRPIRPPADQQAWASHAICSEVLEHLDQPRLLLENVTAYLRPGCRLIVTVPGGPRSAFDRHIGHRQHFSETRLRTLLEAAGFDVRRVLKAGFPFFDLYKLGIVARGERLIRDARPRSAEQTSAVSMTAVLKVFDVLFRANLPSTPWGWQLVAEATPRLRAKESRR